MLDEEEWREIAPLMTFDTKQEALKHYQKLTGHEETNFTAIWHHRISLYGPPCSHCGKPLRTAKAKWCAACGWNNESANKLSQPQPETQGSRMSDSGPQFRNQQEKDAYWGMVRENHERIFGQLDREDRNKRLLIWGGVIAALAAFGYFFGPL